MKNNIKPSKPRLTASKEEDITAQNTENHIKKQKTPYKDTKVTRQLKRNSSRKKRECRKKQDIHKNRTGKIDLAKTYIKNLSKVILTDNEILVLSKNLKFVPTPNPPTTRDLMRDFDDLAKRMRTKLWVSENNIRQKFDPFVDRKRKRTNTPSDNISLENYLTATKIELANMHNSKQRSKQEMLKSALHNIHHNKRFRKRLNGNFTYNLKTALTKLRRNKNIIVKKSDKGNCTVVIDREQYVKEGMRQLNSCAHYTQIENDITPETSKLVHETLLELLSKGEITKKNLQYLSPVERNEVKTAELYLLNKIHSDPPTKARPIISANGCPVERISEFVDFFLQPFVSEQHTYMKDTSDFIRKIEQIKIPAEALIITLDYESMYTNIIHEEAVAAVKHTITESDKHQTVHGIKRPSTDSFCKLIELAVKCNNFKFNGNDYYQCRGVAMGHKASPAICDIVIYYLEERILAQANNQIFKWLRFRDDVFAIYTGSEGEANSFLNMANQIHPTLKFKYDISLTQGIFLDTIVFKGKRFHRENILDFKPYVKPSEKFQYIHRQSSHPKSVFKGLIKGELIRFVRTATNMEDYLERATLFKQKLLLRGYTTEEFDTVFQQVQHDSRNTYLEEKARSDKETIPLVFTTTYNPHLRGLFQAIRRNWEIIKTNKRLCKIFPQKPIIAFRRGTNLRDTLVRARLQPTESEENSYSRDELDILISLLEKDPDSGLHE